MTIFLPMLHTINFFVGGAVSQEFLLWVFFVGHVPPGPWVCRWDSLGFFWADRRLSVSLQSCSSNYWPFFPPASLLLLVYSFKYSTCLSPLCLSNDLSIFLSVGCLVQWPLRSAYLSWHTLNKLRGGGRYPIPSAHRLKSRSFWQAALPSCPKICLLKI
jgi:hypothetical protein